MHKEAIFIRNTKIIILTLNTLHLFFKKCLIICHEIKKVLYICSRKLRKMKYLQNLEVGIVYWVEDFTAPKVFNGLYFECLLTDQKIPAHCKAKSTGIHLLKWEHKVYKPERFNINEHKEIQKMLEGKEAKIPESDFDATEYAYDHWGDTLNYMSDDEKKQISNCNNKDEVDDYLRCFYERS